ncbi:MAG: metal-dependent hydrolase [Gammaproteobacteria bacterium]
MDPLSQAALGGAVGGLVAGRRLGVGRALAWGALAGALPDIDLLANVADDSFFNLRHHRGLTHALWFGPVVGPPLGWLLWQCYRRTRPDPGWQPWVGLMVVALLSHPLLDLFTHYGTQLLTPFSDQRFALPAIPAVDPLYTLILLLGLGSALLRPRSLKSALRACLVLSTSYLALGLLCNARVETHLRAQLAEQGLAVERLGVFPTFLQLPLRRVVVISQGEVRVSFASAWRACPIEWGPVGHAPSAPQLASLLQSHQGRTFAWFTNHWLSVTPTDSGGHRYNDLRFGFSRDPGQGLWSVTVGASDGQAVPVYRNHRPSLDWQVITELFRAGFPSGCEPWLGREHPLS